MSERVGDWMETSSGVKFWPLDPRPEEIDIGDIARALGKLCRFGGHCINFYSVAEHCVLMARAAPDELRLACLLHDAPEAYVLDLPRPLKYSITGYREIEAQLDRVIFAKYGLPYPLPKEVKELDTRMVLAEREQNMPMTGNEWSFSGEPLDVKLKFWSPRRAAREFLKAFREYGGVDYPGWVSLVCHDCGGHGVVSDYGFGGQDFLGERECSTCWGKGNIWSHVQSSALAVWPGGPFVGKESRREFGEIVNGGGGRPPSADPRPGGAGSPRLDPAHQQEDLGQAQR